MSVKISGKLLDGAGIPVAGCVIELRAKKTSPTVVVHVTSSNITGADGAYSISAEPGYYQVTLLREGFPPAYAGEIYVVPTDKPDTLNAFLDAPKDGDLRPEVMKRFEAMVNQVAAQSVQVSADASSAAASASAAASSKSAAATSASAATASATAAKSSETAAAASASAASTSATNAAASKNAAATSAASAAASATDAAASKNAAAEMLSGVLKSVEVTAPLSGAGTPASPIKLSAASTSAPGAVELADNRTTQLMTDDLKAVTPSGLGAVMQYLGGRVAVDSFATVSDLNNATDKPVFLFSTPVEGNWPAEITGSAVMLVISATGRFTQIMIGSDNVFCVRVKNGGVWLEWSILASTKKLSSMGLLNLTSSNSSGSPSNLDTSFSSGSAPLLLFTNPSAVPSNWPVPGATGNDATGVVWMAPTTAGRSVQILVTHSGKMFVRGQNGTPWLAWMQVGGVPLYSGVGTYVFAQCTVPVAHGGFVAASSLRPASVGEAGVNQDSAVTLSGSWKCLGAVAPGMVSLFVRTA